jgi:hypothetical protein
MPTSDRVQLHNDHNVYILGAGFSADACGFPVVRDFMHTMRDSFQWLRDQHRLKDADAIGKVLGFRRDASSAAYRIQLDLEDIEQLFSLATADQDLDIGREVKLSIASALDYARETANPKHSLMNLLYSPDVAFEKVNVPFPFVGWPKLPAMQRSCSTSEFYLGLMSGCWGASSPESRNTIVSFNYDMVAEDACRRLKVEYDYGFDEETILRNECEGHRPGAGLKLLKLHGSVNWSQNVESPSNFLRARIDLFENFMDLRAQNVDPLLIPPSWSKIIGDPPLSQVWQRALESLGTATRIIILGYSMPTTDQHFKYLLAAGLKRNVSLRKIFFVNNQLGTEPGSKLLKDRVFEIFRPQLSEQHILEFEGKTVGMFFGQKEGRRAINRSLPRCFSDDFVSSFDLALLS